MMEAIKLEAKRREKDWKKIVRKSQARKSSGLGEGYWLGNQILSKKMPRRLRGVGGGNMKNLLKQLGNTANGTYDAHFGSKKTIPFLERSKAVPACVVMNREKCSKPTAECLQRESCDLPTANLVRADPQKRRSSLENLI